MGLITRQAQRLGLQDINRDVNGMRHYGFTNAAFILGACTVLISSQPLAAAREVGTHQCDQRVIPSAKLKRSIHHEVVLGKTTNADTAEFYKNNRVLLKYVNLQHQRVSLLVYVQGAQYCGSGGCTALVLSTPSGDAKKADRLLRDARLINAHLPFAVLGSSHGGARDLAYQEAGGGLSGPRWVVLQYNGSSYKKRRDNTSQYRVSNSRPSLINAPDFCLLK